MNINLKKGISLIVLVVTIIVIIILAGSVILSLANNNPIASANKAAFETNIASYNSELAIVLSNQYLQNNSFNPSTFNVGIWDGTEGNINGTIKQYITSMLPADGVKFEIQASKLVYVGSDETEENWLIEMGIANGTVTPPEEPGYTAIGVNVIATVNTTVNGEIAAYNNPIIPAGFKAINTTTTWPTDWNNGLVIEDEAENQFVWVPVDGTNVPYAKWCTTGIAYNNVDISDDTLPTGIVEVDQINNYGGFYIARYESMFDYNGGNIRLASKQSTNKAISDWSTTRDNAHTGYLWNFVNYPEAKSYSEAMATSYGYDTSKVLTHLITGRQWDTALEWIRDSGKSVTDSRAWANHSNSTTPADVTGFGSLQVSGFNENWKANNIYDLAGNTWEWTNEKYSVDFVPRGGDYYYDGTIYSAAYRTYGPSTSYAYNFLTFRTVLYIK